MDQSNPRHATRTPDVVTEVPVGALLAADSPAPSRSTRATHRPSRNPAGRCRRCSCTVPPCGSSTARTGCGPPYCAGRTRWE